MAMRFPRSLAAAVGLLALALCACVTSEDTRRVGADAGSGGGSAGGGGGGGSPAASPDAPGGTTDAAAPDRARGGDAAPDAPAPACTHQLCDGFESVAAGSAPDPATWQKAASTGTIEVVSGMAHSG